MLSPLGTHVVRSGKKMTGRDDILRQIQRARHADAQLRGVRSGTGNFPVTELFAVRNNHVFGVGSSDQAMKVNRSSKTTTLSDIRLN